MKLFEGSDASEFFQADDWTQTDELAARFMAASIAAGYASSAESLAEVSYEMAAAFETERQRWKGAGE